MFDVRWTKFLKYFWWALEGQKLSTIYKYNPPVLSHCNFGVSHSVFQISNIILVNYATIYGMSRHNFCLSVHSSAEQQHRATGLFWDTRNWSVDARHVINLLYFVNSTCIKCCLLNHKLWQSKSKMWTVCDTTTLGGGVFLLSSVFSSRYSHFHCRYISKEHKPHGTRHLIL